jgi:hypothetical protein
VGKLNVKFFTQLTRQNIDMRYLKRSPSNQVEYLSKHREKTIMRSIINTESNAYFRFGNFSHEIIDGKTQYIFPPDNVSEKKLKQMKQGIYLFSMVRKNAKEWLKNNKDFKLPNKLPVNDYNTASGNFEGVKITGTDVNSAYWTIAYNLGIITKPTYEKGLATDLKAVRLATLSTLGAGKKYLVIKEGELTNDEVCIGSDDRLADVYKLIRYTCYLYMNKMKKMLKKDFIAYRTDCIYYVDTKENRKVVQDYLKSVKLTYKQLYDKKAPKNAKENGLGAVGVTTG